MVVRVCWGNAAQSQNDFPDRDPHMHQQLLPSSAAMPPSPLSSASVRSRVQDWLRTSPDLTASPSRLPTPPESPGATYSTPLKRSYDTAMDDRSALHSPSPSKRPRPEDDSGQSASHTGSIVWSERTGQREASFQSKSPPYTVADRSTINFAYAYNHACHSLHTVWKR